MLIWGGSAAFYFMVFLLRLFPSALSHHLTAEFELSAAQFGMVLSSAQILYSLCQIPMGYALDCWDHKKVLIGSIMCCALGTLVLGLGRESWQLYLSRGLVGVGSAVAFLATTKAAAIGFKPRQVPFMLGLTLAVGTIGALIGAAPLVGLSEILGWRRVTLGLAALCGLIALFNLRFFPKLPTSVAAKLRLSPFKSSRFLAAVLHGASIYVPICVFCDGWGVPYLIRRGLSPSEAAATVSLGYLGIALGSPLIAALSRLGLSSRWWFSLSSLGVMGSFLSFNLGFLPLGLCCFLGGVWAGGEMLCFNRGIEIVGKEYAGLSTALMNTFVMGFGSVIQWIFGLGLDRFYLVHEDQLGFSRYAIQGFNQLFFVVLGLCFSLHLLGLGLDAKSRHYPG